MEHETEETEEHEHEEHLRLAGVIKGVHADLRKKYKRNSSALNQIWEEHCQNKPVLSEYADAMHHLAVDHWAKNPETRIDWCRGTAVEYFLKGGLNKTLEKEERKHHYEQMREEERVGDAESCGVLGTESERCGAAESDGRHSKLTKYNSVCLPLVERIRLLDVGSCFNPFLDVPEFQAVGIDISPAKDSVFHCDFLHLQTTDPLQVATDTLTTYINNLKDPIECLPRECFHVVVFSLLLEYFPAPFQRWICCQKAHDLLMYNGILLIVTPDSHRQHRNMPMVKSWRQAIESMGFVRWRYLKQEHLHCMVFRKVEKEEKQDNLISDITPDMLYIPQDLKNPVEDDFIFMDVSCLSSADEQTYRENMLHEMPVFLSDSEEYTSS